MPAVCCCTAPSTGILRQFARCFLDYRQPERIDHSVPELVRQRVYGLALGYEDLNDHDQLRGDPLLAMLSGKADVEGRKRRRKRDRGKAGAGKSTLNRLELTPPEADEKSRYRSGSGAADQAGLRRTGYDQHVRSGAGHEGYRHHG